MTILNIAYADANFATPALPANMTLGQVREQAAQRWAELANATIVVNGEGMPSTTLVGSIALGSTVGFTLPVGTKQ